MRDSGELQSHQSEPEGHSETECSVPNEQDFTDMNAKAKKYLKAALEAPTLDLKNEWIREAILSLEDTECGLGALRVIAKSAHDSTPRQLAAMAQAGIDLVEIAQKDAPNGRRS